MPTKKQNENLMSSGRRDKRSIAKNKRMSSCATGLQNLGASAKKKRTSSCANDIRNDRKNGKEDDDWVFDVDNDSNNEGDSEG
jgi:hypothetical protein